MLKKNNSELSNGIGIPLNIQISSNTATCQAYYLQIIVLYQLLKEVYLKNYIFKTNMAKIIHKAATLSPI